MLTSELESILELAGKLWKNANEAELGLFKKLVSELDYDSVKDIVESVKLDSKYQTFPLKELNSKIKSFKKSSKIKGDYYDCYGLHRDTGQSLIVAVLARSPEGAKEQFNKYLLEYGRNPVDYIVYVGQENWDLFFEARHQLLCENNPNIETISNRLGELASGREVVAALSGSLPATPTPKKNSYPQATDTSDDIPF